MLASRASGEAPLRSQHLQPVRLVGTSRRSALALLLAAGSVAAVLTAAPAGFAGDVAPHQELESSLAALKAMPAEAEGRPLMLKAEDARLTSLVHAAEALAEEGSARSANLLIDRLEDRLLNIYADHAVHFALRHAIEKIAPTAKGDAEIKRRLASDRSWQKQVALAWATRHRPADADTDSTLRSLAKSSTNKLPLRVAAIKALGERRCVAAIEDLIELMERNEKLEKEKEKEKNRLWIDARLALHAATGYDRPTGKAWRELWREKGKGFDPNASRGADPRYVPDYAACVPAERVVIAMDTSGSLDIRDGFGTDSSGGPPADRQRLKRAKDACARLLKALSPKARFNVVRFDSKVLSWQSKGGLVGVSQHVIGSAIDYLAPVEAKGTGTRMGTAIEYAFATEDLEALYVITDGAPTLEGVGNDEVSVASDEVLALARVLNRFRGVRIYAIGFSQCRSALLEVLAREHGGAAFYLD